MSRGRSLLRGTAAAAAVQFVPSVVALGQWTPLRALPGGWCTWRGPDAPRVALTFDDGPDPRTTPRVLDRLDGLGFVATFFVLGSRVRAHPELVDEIAGRGHEIAVHGDHHDHHLARSPRWVFHDLDAALDALAACGHRPRWYRPPYGQATAATVLAPRRRGLGLALWSAWGREWTATDAGTVAGRVTSQLRPGAIVLLHDSDEFSPPGSTGRVLGALEPIRAHLERLALAPVTLSELVPAA